MKKIQFLSLDKQWEDNRKAYLEIIDSILSTGLYIDHPIIREFESNLEIMFKMKYAITLNSCTDALIFSLAALGVGKDDEVITVPNSFIASSAAIEHVGAKSVFIDVDDFHLMDLDLLESAITEKTKAIMPVHLEGKMVNIQRLSEIAKKYQLKVIEDAAQAFGSMYDSAFAGKYSDAVCFSFHPLKNFNAFGDGGLVLTNSEEVANQIKQLKNHGQVERNLSNSFGFVSRLDSIQAGILNFKLGLVDSILARRRGNAQVFDNNLDLSIISIPKVNSYMYHTYHLYVIEVNNRDKIQNELKKEGIETRIHYPRLIVDQPAYKSRYPNSNWNISVARRQSKRILSLPIHESLSESELSYIISKINKLTRHSN